jgi:chromosome segregation ATPase
VSVVLCGLLLSGMLAYQSMQTRRLQDAYAEAQAERDSLANLAETSRQERGKLETRVRSAAEQLVTMEEAVQRAKADAEVPQRVAELEKLVLFLREELKAATQTIDQLRAAQKQNTVLPAGVPN